MGLRFDLSRDRRAGVVGRDALRIQLFVRGYSHPAWDVAHALAGEYVKFGKSITNQVRSGFADNQKSIGQKHKASFVQQLGTLDSRFDQAELRLPDDMYIAGLRTAKQDPISSDLTNLSTGEIKQLLRPGLRFKI